MILCNDCLNRDYAASIGTMRLAAEDLGMDYTKADTGNFFYTIYLDDQGEVPPGQERMLSGLLSRKTSEMKEERRSLMERNKSIGQGVCKINDKECMEKYENIPWEIGTLPSVKAAIVEFPFANGIISALVHSYKVSIYFFSPFFDQNIHNLNRAASHHSFRSCHNF